MSVSNNVFKLALKQALKWEGGYANHPNDPGGETNMGITNSVYQSYLKAKGRATASIKNITMEEVEDIYYSNYFLSAKCDLMPEPLAIVMFDTAVNFGVAGATMFLQEALLEDNNTLATAIRIIEGRIAYRKRRVMESPSQNVFLQGWLNRDNDLMAYIKENYKLVVDTRPDSIHIGNIQKDVLALAISEQPSGNKNMEYLGWNDGPKVRKYLTSVGIDFPAPWCMAFVYWCIAQISKRYGLSEVPMLKSGFCPHVREWAIEQKILSSIPSIGDAVLVGDSYGPAAHVAFVTRIFNKNGVPYIGTVEGNTNIGGSPEGIGIFEREREITSRLDFVKWWKLANVKKYDVYKGDTLLIDDAPLIDGKTYVPIRKLAEYFGAKVEWIKDTQSVVVNKVRMDKIAFFKGDTYTHIRQLCHVFKILSIDNTNYKIMIDKK